MTNHTTQTANGVARDLVLNMRVAGDPKAQGSMKHVGGGRMVHSPGLTEWRQRVTNTAMTTAGTNKVTWRPIDEPVGAALEFVLKRPHRPRWDEPATGLDIDKLQRAVFDGLAPKVKGHTPRWAFLKDDSRVCEVHTTKRYTRPGETPGVNVLIWKRKEE